MSATATKEKPILFSGPMVRAILDGRKSVTRRVITNERIKVFAPGYADDHDRIIGMCPYGRVGDRLWVRETWNQFRVRRSDGQRFTVRHPEPGIGELTYAADCDAEPPRWRPSIHMPRWASRITLEVTGVRVERLQEISEEDARAEGVQEFCPSEVDRGGYCSGFADAWDAINGKRPGCKWLDNPWVWVIKFRRV